MKQMRCYFPLLLILFLCLSCNEEKTVVVPQKRILKGEVIDSFKGIKVYYNGRIGNTQGRNTINGYNCGLKYQCVEFVKRYYYLALNHKMPNTWGHAKDFYKYGIRDGGYNSDRGLYQYTNGSNSKPKVNDLVVFKGNSYNKYGHVAIVSNVTENQIEIVQQNVGRRTRESIRLRYNNGKWKVIKKGILGWLRKK